MDYFTRMCSRPNPRNQYVPGPNGKFACPCCKHYTLDERCGYDICPVCFWEDDGQDDADADEVTGGPNYELSLTVARENYRLYGCCCARMHRHCRPPYDHEIPAAK